MIAACSTFLLPVSCARDCNHGCHDDIQYFRTSEIHDGSSVEKARARNDGEHTPSVEIEQACLPGRFTAVAASLRSRSDDCNARVDIAGHACAILRTPAKKSR